MKLTFIDKSTQVNQK